MTFYFAWVDEDVAFSSPTHDVEDEEVIGFDLSHGEGDFAELKIDIRNPKVNLLGGGRKVWMWLSQDGNEIFYGRLVAAPDNIQGEVITLNFIARPYDYDSQKIALADSLRVAPFWDEIWISAQKLEDPDVVLEGYSKMWHIDRTSHVLTVSDITAGEDGTVAFDEDSHLYDGMSITYGAAPLRRVNIKATVQWDQHAAGDLDITRQLRKAFGSAGSPSGTVSSYTGQGLEADWPKQNTSLKGGWSTGRVTLKRVDGVGRPSRTKEVSVKNVTQTANVTVDGQDAANVLAVPGRAKFYIWEFVPYFPLTYVATRKRIETIEFTLEADVQAIVVEAGADEEEYLTLSTRAVADGASPPIGDIRLASYLQTDRGVQSFEYLLLLARAKLLARARTVQIDITIPFADGLALSCRKNATVHDPRIPNSVATGKITNYTLHADGQGTQYCKVTVSCTIGEGNSLSATPGTETWSDDYVVTEVYQKTSGGTYTISEVSDDIGYDDYRGTALDDDGIDFLNLKADDVIEGLTIYNGESSQLSTLNGGPFEDIPHVVEVLNANFTECELELVQLTGGPFETEYVVTVEDLMIPQTITL